MVVFITGATHTGKTNLAQKMMEKYNVPQVCQDHIKMGLIRSNYTDLTPEDDDKMTDYLWPITREMAKTAIENKQNLIIEGCYIPFDWKKEFDEEYSRDIRYICLCMSDKYIECHFKDIRQYASCIEERMEDENCSVEWIRRDNRMFREGCERNKLDYILIDEEYEAAIRKVMELDIFSTQNADR